MFCKGFKNVLAYSVGLYYHVVYGFRQFLVVVVEKKYTNKTGKARGTTSTMGPIPNFSHRYCGATVWRRWILSGSC